MRSAIINWIKSLQGKLVLTITLLTLFQVLVLGVIALSVVANLLEKQIGNRALAVSKAVSQIPQLKTALKAKDPTGSIQFLAENIREDVGAEFIVVGDHEGRRYAHPNSDKLGKFMVGGDNAPALQEGESYVSRAVGTLGPSIRGKVPIKDESGKVIGIVSTGYLMQKVRTVIENYQLQIRIYIFIFVILGIFSSYYIASGVKKAIFGLEPKEIGRLFGEQTAILDSVREGILAINNQGMITMANQNAVQIAGFTENEELMNQSIKILIPEETVLPSLQKGEELVDLEVVVQGRSLIIDIIPVLQKRLIVGAVLSCRRKDEVAHLAKELSRVKDYSEMLRAQTHEFSNKIHTIAGLLQMGANEEALEMITEEATEYQDFVKMMLSSVQDPVLSALLIGKYSHAMELGINLQIDADSQMHDIPDDIARDKLVLILGNLLNNAFDAVQKTEVKKVMLAMTDLGDDLIFDLDDSGTGISVDEWNTIFEKGISSKKQGDHGYGLFLVKRALEELQGEINLSVSSLGGAALTVIVPKKAKGRHA